MGAYSPATGITAEMHRHIIKDIIEPTVNGMNADGNSFSGFLYAGLMIDNSGTAKVLEYNVRFGDPETQPIMMRLQSDLVQLCNAALDKQLDQCTAEWLDKTALGVVIAAEGYPDNPRLGDSISGLDQTRCVTALGDTVIDAQSNAYKAAGQIDWAGSFYRTDIGYRAVIRESETI